MSLQRFYRASLPDDVVSRQVSNGLGAGVVGVDFIDVNLNNDADLADLAEYMATQGFLPATVAPGNLDTRIFRSAVERDQTVGAFLLITDTAYWVYLGQLRATTTVNFVRALVSLEGAGAQAAEVALASSPVAPNGANQVLTKIGASGALEDLTVAGLKTNTIALAAVVPVGTHLWAGVRTAMAVAQPTLSSLGRDWSRGELLTTAAAGVLTGAGPWTGVVVADAANQHPELRATVD